MSASPAFQTALGLAVAACRKQLGLTQEQLANDSGIHQRYLSNVETGKRNPSYASLRRLAAALGLDASQLVAHAEQIERDGSTDPAAASASKA
ncbi:MAG TPA: helix-turn-helix transcriptional regulator [Solirubrobacteraceae bacterium]|jgi:transcriptional regulator with XRE-family HTH domain